MQKTIEKREKHEVARPLKVLVPLIRADLHDGDEAARSAGMKYYIAAGRKLLEAKSQLDAIQWGDWLTKNFHLSQATAGVYMKAAIKADGGGKGSRFKTLNEVRGDRRKFGHAPDWTDPVRETLRGFNTETFAAHIAEVDREQELEAELGLKLIDIGYRVLAVEMHPDRGGTDEGMRRLNKVRKQLKEAL